MFDSGLSSAVGFGLSDFARQITSCGSKSVVLLHTHPRGDTSPTNADMEATKQIISLTRALGIKLDDHIIVTESQYFSFLNSNLLPALNNKIIQKEKFDNI